MRCVVLVMILMLASGFVPSKQHSRSAAISVSNNMLPSPQEFIRKSISIRGGAAAASSARPRSFLVGNISLALRTFFARSGDAFHRAEASCRLYDLAAIAIVSFLPKVVIKFINDALVNKTIRRSNPLEFENTPYLSKISELLCQFGQVNLWIYFGELFLIFLSALGVPRLTDKPKLLASAVYAVWATRIFCKVKETLLERTLRRHHDKTKIKARRLLYNRAFDSIIYLVAVILFLDANHIDVGVALASLLTLGGVSSVVVGLALKDPVTEIMQGTSLLLSDKFSLGETIRLSDGTNGKVLDIKWTDTYIRGNDDSFIRVPHSQMAKTRIVNLSRMPKSNVSQKLTLPNHGVVKIKQLLQDIEQEIKSGCPKLIADGSEPFRVHWTDIDKGNIVVEIQTHFLIPFLDSEYYDNRQSVLIAISKAVERYL